MIQMPNERSNQLIFLNLELNILGSGEEVSEMVLVNKSGLMVRLTKEIGKTTGHTVRVNSCTLMATYMMALG